MKASEAIRMGDTIKQLRTQKGWSQNDLAEKSGINVVQLRRYENNRAIPRDAQLERISNALGVPLPYFDLHITAGKYIDNNGEEMTFLSVEDHEIQLLKDEKETIMNSLDYIYKQQALYETNPDQHIDDINQCKLQIANMENRIKEINAKLQYLNAKEKSNLEFQKNLAILTKSLKVLNTAGQQKAIEQVDLLTKIPEYKKTEQN